MVMKRSAARKNLLRTIRRSLGRYLAIALIIALGASIFVGLRSTKKDMVATGQKYLDTQNMFDLRLLNNYGWSDADVEAVAQMEGVENAEGQIHVDAVVYYGDAEDGAVYQIHSIPKTINKIYLMGGRMPENPQECLLDGFHADDSVLGTKVTIAQENDATTLESFAYCEYTVVGYVSTPLYMDVSRGSTDLGSGNVQGYLYFMPEAFALEAYTEIALTMQGEYTIYTEAYTQAMKEMAQKIQPAVTDLAQQRYLAAKEQVHQMVQLAENGYGMALRWAEACQMQVEQNVPGAQELLEQAMRQLLEAEAMYTQALAAQQQLQASQLYILDRNTNTGYIALDSNSDIVSGVSRVFPAFFLLVAALVCITTMTRMVEEERTQIGTLKALGYGNWQIIRKYIFYAGSAAIVGCGLGTVLGSLIFPTILWNAYKIIFNILPNSELLIDWPLCTIVVLTYTAVMLLVTWYCCRKALQEAPAQLIRPKAPSAGKKVLLEYLPLWKKLSFLNKVMLRNVVRYRQRMLMMLVGVGGCTALLLTGFGLRDSLVNIVSDQFESVTVYDLSVYFSGPQDAAQQELFLQEIGGEGHQVHFLYQTSAELDYSDGVRELYLMVSDEQIRDFVHFAKDGEDLGMPGRNEIFLSAGIAENMQIEEGDTVILRDSSMRPMEVKVAGIYDNMISNYAFVTTETYTAQMGQAPGAQVAFINVAGDADVHQVAKAIAAQKNVLNVTASVDTAAQVTSMLDALDMVVLTIVICAAALAAIVLYNLTNININERIREIATIKVLGFHAAESAMYVFKENLLLSFMGIGVGMLMGKYLLAFVVSQIKVDIVYLQPRIAGWSCLIAAVLTLLSAVIVDFLLYFRLNKINMAEALKSVE